MSSAFTLATLEATIRDHVEEQGSADEFDDNFNILVQLAEDEILKALPLTIFDARDDVALVAGTQNPDKPTGCILAHELSYTSGSTIVMLYPRRYSWLRAAVPNATQAAPKWFANDYAEDKLWIAPNPNVTATAEALMTKRPDSLVTDSGGTWLSTNLGDLLLCACAANAERFGMAWEDAAKWKADYTRQLAAAHVAFAHLIRKPYMGA